MAPLALTLALLTMAVATVAIKVKPLDMAPDSFDDQYWECGPAMTKALPALIRSEFQRNPRFAESWVNAVAERQRRGLPELPLSSDQAIAVMAYSMKDIYSDFNKATRSAGRSRQEYRDNYHYKTLHFLLTQAVGKLRDTRGARCYNVFWGVNGVLFEAHLGQEVRFGQFTSTSLRKEVAQRYGTDTMFQVNTCHGANITDFSYDHKNLEVLIPPFETFEVIDVTWEGEKRIQLKSIGTYSNYSCEWLRGSKEPRARGGTSEGSVHLGGLLLATTALAVATGML